MKTLQDFKNEVAKKYEVDFFDFDEFDQYVQRNKLKTVKARFYLMLKEAAELYEAYVNEQQPPTP